MDYKIHIKKSCEKDLDKLPHSVFEKIKQKILSLASNPLPYNVKKLKGIKN